MARFLDDYGVSEQEVSSRLQQAAFLLAGAEATEAAPLIRQSLCEQPAYFSQPFAIAYEDDNFLICNKAFDTQIAHGVSQKPRWRGEKTLVEWAQSTSSDPALLKPCHQLDFATSGLLVLAKNGDALSAGSRAFDSSAGGSTSVRKEYTAIVLGWPEWSATTWSGDLEADPASEFKMRVAGADATASDSRVVDADVAATWGPSRMPPAPSWAAAPSRAAASAPKAAVTDVIVEQRGTCLLKGPLFGERISRVRLLPQTGRRHQLRVTLAALGHPIVGDVSYAGDVSSYRLMLHAQALTVQTDPAADSTSSSHPEAGVETRGAGTGRRARARQRRRSEGGDAHSRWAQVLRPLNGRRIEFDDRFMQVLVL